MKLQLEAMALAMPEVSNHPEPAGISRGAHAGGVASQHSPSGARGHRVLLTQKATEAALPSLLGMALDYSPAMDGHDVRRKIGIITDADVLPAEAGGAGQLAVGGYLFAQDFPDVIEEISAGNGALGMSYEITNAWVPDPKAAVWTVTKFTFTGAAVLKRDKAAYPQTWIRLEAETRFAAVSG